MIEKVILLLSLVANGQVGTGTIFGSSTWDRTNPHSRLACDHREIDDKKDVVVAHNHLPCHTRVWLYNPRTQQGAIARVADRGPRHAMIDLSRPLAKRLKHNGREVVMMVPLPDPPGGDQLTGRRRARSVASR